MPHRPHSDGRSPWLAKVVTLLPEIYPGPLGASLAGQALAANIWALQTVDLREFGIGRHRQVDDHPAGGGAGMVLRADVVAAAVDSALAGAADLRRIYLTPRGRRLDQKLAHELAAGPGAVIVAGRFEGLDERAIEGRALEEISIGDYVLSGGDVAAMVLIDTVVRLLPGVVGAAESLAQESFETGLLEHPLYTKPREWEGRPIPDVLLSGDHSKIAAWRRAEAEAVTQSRRPDLLPDLLKPKN